MYRNQHFLYKLQNQSPRQHYFIRLAQKVFFVCPKIRLFLIKHKMSQNIKVGRYFKEYPPPTLDIEPIFFREPFSRVFPLPLTGYSISLLIYARYFFRVALTAPVPAISSRNISSIFSPIPASYKSIPKIFAFDRMPFSCPL